jgi:lipopolysaccharide exporter
MTQSVNASIAKGAVWMLALRFCVKGISIVSIMILARLLTPEDFGLMALATSVYALVELFRAFGFSTALIQKQNASRAHYDSAWTMQVIFAILSASLLMVISKMASEYYGDLRLINILYTMAAIIFISGFKNIGVVQFKKEMTFNREFKYQLLIKLSAFSATIPLAWYLQNYWALLVGMFMSNLVSVFLSYTMQNYRPKLCLKEYRSLLGFSSWLMFNNILFFLNNHSQNFIVGKVSGSSVLGAFSISKEVATMTTNEIVAPINAAAYPGYAKISHDKALLKESYLKVLSGIILISLPSAIGIAAIAPLFVPVLLGDKWLVTIPIIQIIALSSILTSMNTNSGYVYMALAKQKITTILMSFRTIVFLPLLYLFSLEYGAVGAAASMLVVTVIFFPINQHVLKKQIDLTWTDLFLILYRPLLSGLFMGYIVNLSVTLFITNTEWGHGIVPLLLSTVLGAVVFTLSLLLLWLFSGKVNGAEAVIFNRIMKFKGKSFG